MRLAYFAMLMASACLSGLAAAQPAANGAPVENEAQYLARCRTETIAKYPNARAQAASICQSNWMQIVAAGPMAGALLTAAPPQGGNFDPASVKARLTMVRWAARPRQGTVVSGAVGDVDVAAVRMPAPGLTFSWSKDGDTIPFNLEDALRVRGAAVAMIACQAFGASEGTQIYRVAAGGKAPFALTIAKREAAVASQSSDFSAVADFSGQMPGLAALRRDGSEWNATCPQ